MACRTDRSTHLDCTFGTKIRTAFDLLTRMTSQIPLAVLAGLEHFRSSTPSMLVICYTLLKGLFTAVTLRTYMKSGLFYTSHALAVLTAVSTAAYLSLLCVELIEKRRLLLKKVRLSVSTVVLSTTFKWYSSPCLQYLPQVFFPGRCVSGSSLFSGLDETKHFLSKTAVTFQKVFLPGQLAGCYTRLQKVPCKEMTLITSYSLFTQSGVVGKDPIISSKHP